MEDESSRTPDLPQIDIRVVNPYDIELTPEIQKRINSGFLALNSLIYAERWSRRDLIQPCVIVDDEGDIHLAVAGPDFFIDQDYDLASDDYEPGDRAVYPFAIVTDDADANNDAYISMLEQMKFTHYIDAEDIMDSIAKAERFLSNPKAIDTSISLKDVVLAPIRIPVAVADKMLSYLRRI